MTYVLGQIIKEIKTYWECVTQPSKPIEVIKEWKVCDILYNGDIVIGECEGEYKILYQRDPYVIGCNDPIILNYNRK